MGNCMCFKKRNLSRNINHEELKVNGNELFRNGKYEDAIVEYSKAILADSKKSIYYSNRALCYYKIKAYSKAFEDSNAAYVLDNII